MAWSAMPTFSAGATLTAAQLNLLVANLNETGPAKATAGGRLLVTTGANAIAEREVSQDFVTTSESTSNTSYTTLATAGPAVTVTTGPQCIVVTTGRLTNNTTGAYAVMSFEITGATTLAASDTRALMYQSVDANSRSMRASVMQHVFGTTPGSNTFNCRYRASAGTATFADRYILVFAL